MSNRDLGFQFGISVTTPRYALVSALGIVGSPVNPLTAGFLIDATTGSYFIPQVNIGSNRGVLWTCATSTALTTFVPLYETLSAQEIDTQLTGTHGSGSWGAVNTGTGAYPITVTVTDGTDPLQVAFVRVSDGITPHFGVTDVNGNLTFSLDAATYTVTITKPGYTFTPTTRTVTGSQTGTLINDLEMTMVAPPTPPTDPAYCRIYGFMRDQKTGNLLKGVQLIATRVPSSGKAYAGGFLIGSQVSAASDSTGLVQLDVLKNTEITPTGSQWQIVCMPAGINTTQTLSASTFDLSTLI